MKQKLSWILLLLLGVLVDAEDERTVIVESAKELNGIAVKKIIWKKDGAKMALIPAGSFEMGESKRQSKHNWVHRNRRGHNVQLASFYMDVTEVTVGHFKQFINQSGYSYDRWDDVVKYSPADNYPMIYVSWNDAVAYSKWVGKRIPTEAEWEYAARGGLVDKVYPWGDEISHDDANWGNTISGKDKWRYCSPVASFEANGYGLYDMSGNVWEWCADWYDADYYSKSPAKAPLGPASGSYRVMRGGSWNYGMDSLRTAYRFSDRPTDRYNDISGGFRCVVGEN